MKNSRLPDAGWLVFFLFSLTASAFVHAQVADGPTITDVEGNTYKTIKIGSQVWMAENLRTTRFRDGSIIPMVSDDARWSNLSTPAYCWYHPAEAANRDLYGGLYNWHAVNTAKLCPEGWHVPDDEEWGKLTDQFGPLHLAGDRLKEIATGTGTGFSPLPGGHRDYQGTFMYRNYLGYWWTSSTTEFSEEYAWHRHLNIHYGFVYLDFSRKTYGYSVRCIQDQQELE